MLWTSATGQRVSWVQMLIMVVASTGTVGYWLVTGSLWPYAIVQFGGLAVIVGATIARKVDAPLGWATVIVFYAIAKVFESLDWQIWTLTGHLFAGHALKHIASGLAGGALLLVVKATKRSGADAAR
jgi:hypothetical protein